MRKLPKISNFLGKRNKEEAGSAADEQEMVKAGERRRRGNAIIDELDEVRILLNNMQSVDLDGTFYDKINKEELEQWRKVIFNCKRIMEQASSSSQNTSQLDYQIQRLIGQFRIALDHKDEEAAGCICKFVGKSVVELRRDVEDITEEAIERELANRAEQAEQMADLAENRNRMYKLKETSENYTKHLKERKPAMERAFAEVKAMQAKYPELKNAVEEGLVERKKMDGIAFEINTAKARAAAIKDEVENLILLRANTNAEIQSLETTMHTLEQMLLETAGKIPQDLVQSVEELTTKFQAQLAENSKIRNDLEEANKKFRHMLDSFFTSSTILDRMMENEIRFAEMEREMRQKEELRKEAFRRQKLEEQERENEETQKQEAEEPLMIN